MYVNGMQYMQRYFYMVMGGAKKRDEHHFL